MPDTRLYDDVLVATDGSEAADVAVDHALSVAAAHDARVHALFVIDTRITMAADDDMRDELSDQLRANGDEAIDRIVSRAGELSVQTTGTVARGTPWKEILAHADAADIDMIVIGTTGKTPREKRMGMGSVSERVVDDATIPVLVVPQSPT